MKNVKDIPVQHHHREMLPVWFFIGLLLLTYGVIILWVGIRDYHQPTHVVLASYHANLWGGGLLFFIGGFYTLRYWPRHTPHSH